MPNVTMRTALLLLLAAASTALAGCQRPGLPTYETSRDTLFYLQQLRSAPVAVGTFSGGPDSLADADDWSWFTACRPRVSRREGRSYHDFMRQALIDELSAAGLYTDAPDARVISGRVEYLGFDNRLSPFDKVWELRLRLVSSNGKQLAVEARLPFDTGAFAGPTTCARAIEAFAPSVQQLLQSAVMSPEFVTLLD